jgi:adenylate cyclase
VTYLDSQGAAAIGVDLLIPDSDRQRIADLASPEGIGNLESMGRAVGLAGNVVLPLWILPGREPIRPVYEWVDEFFGPWNQLGFVNLTEDPDTYVRQQQLRTIDDEGFVVPSFALSLFAESNGLTEQWASEEPLCVNGKPIPLNADGQMRINYVGPPGTIPSVPFRDVLRAAEEGLELDCDFHDAVVLIGVTGFAGQDWHATPYVTPTILATLVRSGSETQTGMMSGVETHANVLATLMDEQFIVTPHWLAAPVLLGIFGVALGAAFARMTLEGGALLTIAHHVLWQVFSVVVFRWAHWRIETVSMLLLGVLLYGSIFSLRWRWIRRMMGMVKSESVARAMEATGSLNLEGEEREITVLFADIRGFTPFSEQHNAPSVVQLLDAFFTAIVPVVEQHGGIVNQYIGDALMVLFGAPESQPDHATRAVTTAVAMVRRVHELQTRWKELGAAEFRIGVGVHTGRAVVGMVGSPRRLDYTAIGDTVNTAARIESGNKELNAEILISRSTFDALSADDLNRLAADWQKNTLSVKGKAEALEVFAGVVRVGCSASSGDAPI